MRERWPARLFEEARVASRRDLGDRYFVLAIDAPAIAAWARPGQFVMLSTRSRSLAGSDPLLPRPFSFLAARDGTIELLVKVVGRGTGLLSRARPGDRLAVLGPLGRGFTPPSDPAARPLLVAGGVGIAPLLHLAPDLPAGARLLVGGRTAADLLLLDEARAAGLALALATEDGSLGHRGMVTDLVPPALSGEGPGWVYTCGPSPMMAAVARLARGVPVQASLEARMACGLGICRGCAVPLAGGGYLEACDEGPVVDGHAVWG